MVEPFRIQIEVMPPFYLRPWFLVLLSVFLFTVISLIVGYLITLRKQVNQRKAAELKYSTLNATLEKTVGSRTSQLEEAMKQLRLAHTQLLSVEKYKTAQTIVVGFSHEISTPLGNALTALSLIEHSIEKKNTEEFSPEKESLHIAMTALKRSIDLVGRLKELQDIETDIKEIDIQAYILDFIEMYEREIEEKNFTIQVKNRIHEKVLTSSWALLRILNEMYVNSVSHGFTDPVRTDYSITILLDQNETHLLFSWSDNGEGISQEALSQVFDPFYTTSRSNSHSGLGLYNLQNLVTQFFKGTVDIESNPGKGTRIFLQIPRNSH